MGIYESAVLPRIIDKLLSSAELSRLRQEVCRDLSGTVLEIGFGSGLNVPHLPSAVDRLIAIDPATVGRKLAAERIEKRGIRVDYLGLDGADIDLPDESVDHVLCTMTLCTIPDVRTALSEVRRVLKKGGSFAFLEHGRSPESKVHARQRTLTPLQKRLFGGCHLDRDPIELVSASGLTLESSAARYERGPRIMSYFTRGIARKP
jgi:ubiquinone/menaquinone biosynthesis C-methylase UbiE